MIDFNIAPHTGNEVKYIQEAIASGKICGDGTFTKKCSQWMKEHFYTNQAFLTTSCTLSSAIASNLAKGRDLETSVKYAKNYISGALAAMLDLGKGSGPMNHAFAVKGEYEG